MIDNQCIVLEFAFVNMLVIICIELKHSAYNLPHSHDIFYFFLKNSLYEHMFVIFVSNKRLKYAAQKTSSQNS